MHASTQFSAQKCPAIVAGQLAAMATRVLLALALALAAPVAVTVRVRPPQQHMPACLPTAASREAAERPEPSSLLLGDSDFQITFALLYKERVRMTEDFHELSCS